MECANIPYCLLKLSQKKFNFKQRKQQPSVGNVLKIPALIIKMQVYNEFLFHDITVRQIRQPAGKGLTGTYEAASSKIAK